MTDETSAPIAAPAPPVSQPVETPVSTPEVKVEPPVNTNVTGDDFDENLIPETSRENFKKYRDSSKAKLETATRERYQLEARLRQIEQTQQRPVDTEEIGEAPKLEDAQYKNIEDYTKALTEWAEKKGRLAERQSLTQADQQRRAIAEQAKMYAKGQRAMAKYSDFQAVTQPLVAVADHIPELRAFVQESDSGTDILYQLCKNPTLLDGLLKMTPVARAREIIRLEGLASAPQTKSQTKAPAPMNPVGGGDGNVTTLIDLSKKENASEYIARRNREDLRRKKGLN
jgi:hypothetical protein